MYAIRLFANPFLERAIETFVSEYKIEQIILVDGGVDAMIYGDERPFGSPLEDSQTVLACASIAHRRNIPCRLVCNGLSIDEVNSETFLRHFREYPHEKYVVPMSPTDLGFLEYKRIVEKRPLTQASIIHESIIAAIEGHRGKYNHPRLREREPNSGHMPVLIKESGYLWCINVIPFVFSYSPFYRKLVEKSNEAIQQKSDFLFRFWNNAIDTALGL